MIEKENFSISMVDGSGSTERCSLEFWSDSMANLKLRSSHIGELTSEADDVFEAMCKIRLQLEIRGYLLLCNGARRKYKTPKLEAALS